MGVGMVVPTINPWWITGFIRLITTGNASTGFWGHT